MRLSAFLFFIPIMAVLNCTSVGRASDFMMASIKAIHFSWLEPDLLVCCLSHRGSTGVSLFAPDFQEVIGCPGISIVGQTESVRPRF